MSNRRCGLPILNGHTPAVGGKISCPTRRQRVRAAGIGPIILHL